MTCDVQTVRGGLEGLKENVEFTFYDWNIAKQRPKKDTNEGK